MSWLHGEAHKHHLERKQPGTKEHMLCNHIPCGSRTPYVGNDEGGIQATYFLIWVEVS